MKLQFGTIKRLISLTVFRNGQNDIYNGFEIKFHKGEIEIVNQFKNIIGTETVIKSIVKNKPVLLHIEGKGVLNKKHEVGPGSNPQIIPHGEHDDFYVTNYTQNHSVYASIVRKTALEGILSEFNEHKIMVISIASGPFIMMAIEQYLDKAQLISRQYKLTVNDHKILDYQKYDANESQLYRIGKDTVSENGISALANAAIFFQPVSSIELPEKDEWALKNIEESEQKVLFQQFGFGLMIFFLIALTGNYLYLQHLNKVHQSNVFQLADFTETFNQINQLEEEKTRKETLLRQSGVLTKKFVSFYMATITNSVPKEISLTEFTVRPTKDEIKAKYKIEVDNQLLMIRGIAKSSHDLSDWLTEIKTFDWIRKVDIEAYEYTKGQGEFYLKIII